MFKSIFKAVAVSAVAAVFSIGCGGGDGGGGNPAVGGARDAKTYTGTANGVTYTLKIEDGGTSPRAALTPTSGDKYTLTQNADSKKSTGTVTKKVGDVLTLAPKEDPDDEFTAAVSGDNITAMSGNITWDDGTANKAPETLTPSGGGGGEPADTSKPNTGGGGDDSYTYNGGTVEIGGKTWMAKNLDRATTNSKCYNNSADSCAKYGRLYNWEDAKSACPSGWRLPSDAEWTALTDAVGDSSTAGTKLKSTSGWNSSSGKNGNGTDDYGFAALPGGYYYAPSYADGDFYDVRNTGYWWSSTEGEDYGAWEREIKYFYGGVSRSNGYTGNLYSVRCVAD